jgi:signal transduction histidine kinase/ActR/RegA family two-component response regulator
VVLLLGTAISLLAFSLTRRESMERLRAQEAGRRLALSEGERMRLLEAERTARHEAEKANLLKDEFLATLSHELRTPLNAVLGWTHILQRSQDERTLREGLVVIERNARAQASLIADLLDMNRIMAGKVKLDAQPVALQEVLEAALDTVRPAAAAKRIAIDTRIDASVGELLGDAARLQQVFWNLLSNAVKFTPEGGSVRVEAARQGQRVVARVSDTGRGISPAFLPYVFERFRQADGAPSRSTSGLGLGLAIVRQLVEMHGGRVRADSRGEGRGAAFTVELPLRPPLASVEAPPVPVQAGKALEPVVEVSAQPSLDGVTVLVVDDEADSLEVVRRLLEASNARVVPTRSAPEALRVLREVRPTVLVSDLAMPGTDGYQLIRDVRSLGEEIAGVPAAALTAYASAKDRERVMQAGFQAYLTKPVQPAELTRTVAALAKRF